MDVPPVIQPAVPPPPPRSGCVAKGCLALVIALVGLALLAVACGWFGLSYLIRTYTDAQPRAVPVENFTTPQLQSAEAKMDTLRRAIRDKAETTIEFSAADINALIAHDPAFQGARGHAHLTIENALILLELSAPLNFTPWNRLKDRWFNGRLQFGLSYVDDEFNFDFKSAEANGRNLPGILFTSDFLHSFNRSLNDSFHRESRRHADDLWRHLKMISVQNNQLIVTTRGT